MPVLPLLAESVFPPSTYPTLVDLSTKFGYAAKISTVGNNAGRMVLCDSQGERPMGVIRDSTSSDLPHGVEIACTPGQIVTCLAGTNGISGAGVEVTVAADGRFESAAAADIVIGYANRAAADGETFECFLTSFYAKA